MPRLRLHTKCQTVPMDFIEVGSLNAVKSDKEFRQINRLKKRERDKNKKRKKKKRKRKKEKEKET